AMTLACLVGVIGSYSRSAWLLLIAGIVLFLALIGKSVWTARRAVMSGLCALLVVSVFAPAVLSRLNPRDRGTQASNAEHARTMHRALELTKAHPLTGVGIGANGDHAR